MIMQNRLEDLLAELYGTQGQSRRVVEGAGLPSGFIEFKDQARENWHNILLEAKKRKKVEALVTFACDEYKERAMELQNFLQAWVVDPMSANTLSTQNLIQSQPREQESLNQAARPGLESTSRTLSTFHLPAKEDILSNLTEDEEEVFIGRELHWDRISVARMFLNMIKKPEEQPLRVLGIQAPLKEGLDSLVNRFEKVCKSMVLQKPLLYAKIQFHEALNANWLLARNILSTLRENARRSDQDTVRRQMERLTRARDTIETRTNESNKRLTDSELCDILTDCLDEVARECTVVLLLPGFEKLRDSKGELQSSQWLRDMWIPERACNVKGLVILITAESGLDQLANIQSSEIYCFHPAGNSLPSMKPEDFEEWARVGFGIKKYTAEMAKRHYDMCHGSPKEFLRFLEFRAMEQSLEDGT